MKGEKKIHLETLTKEGFPDVESILGGEKGHLSNEAVDSFIRGKDKLGLLVRQEIERHLRFCGDCREKLNEESKKLPPEPPKPQDLSF